MSHLSSKHSGFIEEEGKNDCKDYGEWASAVKQNLQKITLQLHT